MLTLLGHGNQIDVDIKLNKQSLFEMELETTPVNQSLTILATVQQKKKDQ